MEWENRSTFGMNTIQSNNYIKKCYKQKLSGIKFPAKNLVDAYLYLPQKWSRRASNICHFLNYALE